MQLNIYYDLDDIRMEIVRCQRQKHTQQVAYSTYHDCLTQICFTCHEVRTSISEKDLKLVGLIGKDSREGKGNEN